MEPSGRNQWQPVANARSLKSAETSQNGKEGVSGSSPEEGSEKLLLIRPSKSPGSDGFEP
jgi:hypothetical protein